MMPDQSRPFQIETDASKYAIGAVLTQLDLNGDRHPVSFISKTFSTAERNYEIYDHELLAIIRALEKWRHYIQGSPHTTVILSDHKNLTYYCEVKKLNRWQAWCTLYLLEFDVKLVQTPGNKMVQSDALSQWPDICPDNDTENENMIMLPDNMFLNLIDMDLQQKTASNDGWSWWQCSQSNETPFGNSTHINDKRIGGLEKWNNKWMKHSFLQRKEPYTKKYEK